MRFAMVGSLGLALLVPAGQLYSQKGTKPQLVASTEPKSPAEERKQLHLPPGFAVELVVAEPNIRKPLNLTFDDRGRLWVSDTVEYPFPAKDRKGRDSVKILEDTDGDGFFDKVTTFADGLNIPVGVLPLPTSPGKPTQALVFSIPNIWRLTDNDGDGKADKQELLYGSFGQQDTHGLTGSFTWGFDGWIYAHHGFANTSSIKAADGSSIQMHSGNTYRLKADGTRVEQYTWGQVNPYGLCFDPRGDLYSADCHSRPAMLLLRGGWYPSFGKPHDGLGFAPELMTHDHGSTALCGICYYAADHFPPEYRDTLYIGNVVTNRVNHDRLERRGSAWRAVPQPDFVVSDDPWFRPVDIRLGPDGALYVADFYNRIIGHYEVALDHPGRDRERGRIWRIVYRGPDGKQKPGPIPNLARADIRELINYLAHPNLHLRLLAANQLLERDRDQVRDAALAVVDASGNPWQRLHAAWVLERLGRLDDKTLARLVKDREAAVRLHACRILSERRKLADAQRKLLWAGLKDDDAFVQRAAADALGQQPAPANLRPLLDLRQQAPAQDAFLVHTVRMALRNQLRGDDAWAKLPPKLSDADKKAIADVALGVPSAAAADFLVRHLAEVPEASDTQARYVRHAARHAAGDRLPALVAFARASRPDDLRHQASLVRAVVQGTQERGGQVAGEVRDWGRNLTGKLLAAKDQALIGTGIELAGLLRLQSAQEPLATLTRNQELPESLRKSAASALVQIQPRNSIPLLGGMLQDAAEPPGLREHAAGVLAGLNQPESRAELVKALPAAPARLQSAIALGLAASPEGAKLLLDAVEAGKASARLLQEKPVELRLGQTQLPGLRERLARLTANLPPADQRLQALIKTRLAGFAKAKPDAAVGLKVFEKHCANCHQIANQGAKVGPQLDGIGQRGLERLLEDLIDPNRNVDQAFRTTTLTLKNGQLVSGLLLRDEGAIAVLADQMGKEVRVPKKDIDEKVLSNLSPMPANLIEQVPEAEFYHLIAYLLAQRQAPAKK